MTVNRMARRFAIALAFGLAVGASAFAGQDALAHAKDLYASAAYDEALAMLERLQHNPSSTDEAEVGQYRAFCLLALGRSEEGRRAIQVIVESNPLFLPSEQQTPPRLLAVFRDVRRQVLPRVVRDSYTNAKSAFDQKEMESAATGFDRVLLLLNDPDSTDSEGSGDIRMLATGFRDLSKLGLKAVPSATAVSPSAPSAPSAVTASKAEAPPEAPEPRRTYGPEDTSVTAPVAVSQTLPPWRYSKLAEAHREYQGVLALVIDESGNVQSVALLEGVQPEYNATLVKAARSWKFRPAMKDGLPVQYRKVVRVHLSPPS
jgi:tetratricopeptide (TPR) repeat protein